MKREQVANRRYGSEIEYGYLLTKGVDHDSFHPGWKTPDITSIGTFLQNGGRLYPDEELIEYSTPECPTLEELVLHEVAGERMVHEAYGGASEILSIHKRGIVPKGGYTTGAHENYSTRIRLLYESANDSAFDTHLAARTIFTGAGSLQPSRYVLGQKIRNDKKWHFRTQRSDAEGGPDRLELLCGDPNISLWALKMKFGTTSLVLRLLEQGVDLSDLALANPKQAAIAVAGKAENMSKPLKLASGKTMSALNLEEEFAGRAAMLPERFDIPQDEQDLIPDWFSITDSLRRYSETGETSEDMKQIDWYTKQERIDRVMTSRREREADPERDYYVGLAYELQYDQVPNGFGVKLRQEGKRFAPHAPSEEQIVKARTTPPKGRPKLRGAVIEGIKKGQVKGSITIKWDHISLFAFTKKGKKLSLGPVDQDYTDEEIKKETAHILAGVLKKPKAKAED